MLPLLSLNIIYQVTSSLFNFSISILCQSSLFCWETFIYSLKTVLLEWELNVTLRHLYWPELSFFYHFNTLALLSFSVFLDLMSVYHVTSWLILYQIKTERKINWLNVDSWLESRCMGAQVAPVAINIYDSDMTHGFVAQSRVPACAANSRLPLLQHRCVCRWDIKKKKSKKTKLKQR